MTKDDDIGHYRVVKGYDDSAGTVTQDDSMQGHNVQYSCRQGNLQAARAEFAKAVFYNTHLKAAQDALRSVS